jgi:hypothetical protein
VSRRSYSGLMSLPAWGLYDKNGKIVATVRTKTSGEAVGIFNEHGLVGLFVKKVETVKK